MNKNIVNEVISKDTIFDAINKEKIKILIMVILAFVSCVGVMIALRVLIKYRKRKKLDEVKKLKVEDLKVEV